jgi:hypothetical protein
MINALGQPLLEKADLVCYRINLALASGPVTKPSCHLVVVMATQWLPVSTGLDYRTAQLCIQLG